MPKEKKESYIEKIPSEEDDYYSEDPYEIPSWGADLSFRELITMYEEGELLKPEIQRNYVWDKSEASRFIESLLLGLPIPSIFLAKKKDSKLIVDGFQRIMTVYDFVKGVFSKDDSVFKLSNTEKINVVWRGKTFNQLSEGEQRRILSSTIHSIVFMDKKSKEKSSGGVLYQVFERINTGGRTLTPQEIRNCVYQGEFNRLLISLNENPLWRDLYGQEKKDPRMNDIEFILRFFALGDKELLDRKVTQISLKKELNDYMGNLEVEKEEVLKRLKKNFQQTIRFIHKKIGSNAFHNFLKDKEGNFKGDGSLSEKFHPTVFDAISIATKIVLERNKNIKVSNLEKKRLNLLKDSSFVEYSSIRTTNIENIRGRISLALKYLYGENL